MPSVSIVNHRPVVATGLESILLAAGLVRTDTPADADVVVLGSGAGTDSPDELVARAGRLVVEHTVVALLPTAEPVVCRRLVDLGCHGIVVESATNDEIVEHVLAVIDGRSSMHPQVVTALLARRDSASSRPHGLTHRELAVLRLAADGATNDAIGSELGIAGSTVKTHLANLCSKLGVTDRTAAVAVGFRRGLLS